MFCGACARAPWGEGRLDVDSGGERKERRFPMWYSVVIYHPSDPDGPVQLQMGMP